MFYKGVDVLIAIFTNDLFRTEPEYRLDWNSPVTSL